MSAGVVAAHYVAAASSGAYDNQILASGASLLGYWKLNDASGTQMTDSSGNGRHGTYTGSLTLGAADPISQGGGAVDFSGGYGQVPYAAWMAPATFTIELIIQADTMPSTDVGYVTRHVSGSPSWEVGAFGTNSRCRFYGGAWNSIEYATPAGAKYVITVTWDGTTRRLYTNGVERANLGGGYNTSGAPLTIGHYGNGFVANGGFDGRISRVSFRSGADSAATISSRFALTGI